MSEQKKTPFFQTPFGVIVYLILILLAITVGGELVGFIFTSICLGIAQGLAESGKTVLAAFVETAGLYAAFISVLAAFLIYFAAAKKDRPILKTLGHGGGNTVPKLLLGFVIGFVMNMFCCVVAMLHKDISLSFNTFGILPVIVLFLLVFIQSATEEAIFRGLVFQKLKQNNYSDPAAVLVSALLFMAVHLGNQGLTIFGLISIVLSGILFAQFVLYFDSIWMAMSAHTAWNFTQNILLGLPNSGTVVPYSIFRLDTAASQDSFAYSTSFGLEGTVTSLLLHIVIIAVLWFLCGRKRNTQQVSASIN